MALRLGLGGRLLTAFVVIAGLPGLAGLMAWSSLRDVSRTQEAIITTTIPAIADMRAISEESARIVASAPGLAEVTTEEERAARAASLTALVAQLSERLRRLPVPEGPWSDGLRNPVLEISPQIAALDDAVGTRLTLRSEQEAVLAEMLDAASQLAGMADTLVANAGMGTTAVISNLYELENDPAGGAARLDALDKLIEVDLFLLGQMVELRSRAAEIGLLINQLPGAATPEDVAAIAAEFEAKRTIIARRVGEIRDPARAQQARALLAGLGPVGDRTIFRISTEALTAEASIRTLQERLRLISADLGQGADALARRTEDRARAAATAASADLNARLFELTAVTLAALAIALGVVWFYVRGRVTRRLDRLSDSMERLAEGDLALDLAPEGTDEIAGMETAVTVFRDQAVAKQALEAERTRNEQELRTHREELQRLVTERTTQLRAEVDAHAAARDKAEAADRAKSEFLAMMSHEIRTPMHGVLGMLRGLPDEPLTPRQMADLEAALSSGESLLAILNSILDLSRVESGRIPVTETAFDPGRLARDVAGLMKPIAGERGLKLMLDVGAEVPEAVLGDAEKVRQILFNLLSNAVKFTGDGEIVLRVRSAPGGLTFEVSDTGEGIAADAQARIFEAFEQASAPGQRPFAGTGLGLAICKRLADAMGARLEVESTPGVGSVFTLSCRMEAAEAADLAPDREVAVGPRAAEALDILVVEDNQINQMVAQSYLRRMGHRPVVAGSGEVALERAAERRFDAILLDINLPGIDGVEVVRALAAPDHPNAATPVIGMSAHVQTEQVSGFLDAGLDCFVAKPVSPERLARALDEIMAGRRGTVLPSPREAVTRDALDESLAEDLAVLGPDRLGEIVALFRRQLPEQTEAIAEAVKRGDTVAAQKQVHRLRGAVGNFALPELAALLTELEELARAGDPAPLRGRASALAARAEAADHAIANAWARLEATAYSKAAVNT